MMRRFHRWPGTWHACTVTALILATGQLDLTGLPPATVGGQLTSNPVGSRFVVGPDSDPPDYTQPSMATVRLGKKRQAR